MKVLPALVLLGLQVLAHAQCEEAVLTRPYPGVQDGYGSAVSLSGIHALVGSAWDPSAGTNAGAVRVYEDQLTGWAEIAFLTASDAQSDDLFGHAVALDGTVALIGAVGDDVQGPGSGSAYVFEQQGSSWVQVDKLTASDGSNGNQFGSPLCVAGSLAAIAAPRHSADSGAVYVFEKLPSGWTEVAKILSLDLGAEDGFGKGLSVSGQTVVVGAPGHDAAGIDTGAAYVFRAQPTWQQIAKLVPNDPRPGMLFGESVSISGNTIAIGAPGDATVSAGSVYVFEPQGSGWRQDAKLIAPDLPYTANRLGTHVSLNTGILAAGTNSNPGHTVLFHKGLLAWTHLTTIDDPTPSLGWLSALSLDSGRVLSGIVNDSARLHTWSCLGADLCGCPPRLSMSAGGTHRLSIDAGVQHAGELYIVLGSYTGSSPGFPLQGFHVPLNPDQYFEVTINAPNNPPLLNTFGVLDHLGTAQAFVDFPPLLYGWLAGSTFHHSAVVFDLPPFHLTHVTVASSLDLDP